MQLGIVGLGRMGANMTRRLIRGGHSFVVSDLSPDAVKQLGTDGATGSSSLEDLVNKLNPPRAVWIMVPAGAATEATVQKLCLSICNPVTPSLTGATLFSKDDVRRSTELERQGNSPYRCRKPAAACGELERWATAG